MVGFYFIKELPNEKCFYELLTNYVKEGKMNFELKKLLKVRIDST